MAIGGHITGSGVIESVIGASVQRGRDRTAEVAVRRAKRELEEEAFKLNRAGSAITTLRNNLKTQDETFGLTSALLQSAIDIIMDATNVDFETARKMVVDNPNLDNYKKVIIDAVFNNDKTVYGSISLGGRNVINNASEAH